MISQKVSSVLVHFVKCQQCCYIFIDIQITKTFTKQSKYREQNTANCCKEYDDYIDKINISVEYLAQDGLTSKLKKVKKFQRIIL